MKNPILTIGVVLFFGQLFVASGQDADMDAIRTANAQINSTNVPHSRWEFETVGNTIRVYMFAQNTANPPNILHIRVGAGGDNTFPSNTNYGDFISIGCAAGQTVQISLENAFNDIFQAWNFGTDGFCHVLVREFPGYDKTGMSIPPGLWLGWEDARDHTNPFDYNNFCVVLTGCKARFVTSLPCGGWGTTYQNPPLINMGNRIIDKKIENKY
jgi:hypothetical protein